MPLTFGNVEPLKTRLAKAESDLEFKRREVLVLRDVVDVLMGAAPYPEGFVPAVVEYMKFGHLWQLTKLLGEKKEEANP